MKKLALLLIFGITGIALSADEYTIQTISALKESSITPAFEKKVQKSALPSKQTKEGVCNIVTVGQYTNAKEAKANLKKAKAIAKDAFVRPVARVTPKVCENSGKETVAMKADMNASAVPVAVQEAQPAVVEKKESLAVAATECPPVPEVQKESSAETMQTAVFIYDRNLARKSDIHEAIEYYKNSPYYSFRQIGLPR